MEQGWARRHPFLELDLAGAQQRIRTAIPTARVLRLDALSGGLRNSNYRVTLAAPPDTLVLRLYTADPTACAREAALARLVGEIMPVPAVLHAEPGADPPFAIMSWIEGTRLDELLRDTDAASIERVARAAGRTLAAIHHLNFPTPGFLDGDLNVVEPLPMGGADWLAYLQHFLYEQGVGALLGEDLSESLWRLAETNAPLLDSIREDAGLVHADYKPWNLLVRSEGTEWMIVGVLDWEFAFAGSPLFDVAIFLRQEAVLPPEYRRGFIAGYEAAGGRLPQGWSRLCKLLDLLNLCSMLDGPGLGDAFVQDVRALARATLAELGG